MKPEKLCSKCGAPVSDEVAGGFCTACLLEEGLSPADLAQNPIALRYFGDYELIEEIARGGMGVVFKARQRSLDRIVAVKMILSGHLASEAQAQRFRAEARAAAALQHPGIVAIHEVGEHEGLLFFSMDYIEGQNLAQLVHDGPWPATRAAQCVREIAEAIQYAHEQGVLHRDLKPSNVLMDANGKPHVTDFGLAKQLNSDNQLSTNDPQLTQSGQVLGSPNFMPPEQAAGKHHELTPAADVYSLGAILYHCLTGRPPFVAETLAQTLRMLAEQESVSPRLLNASVPRDLETICLKCLEKDPKHRYTTARDLADELGRFLRHEPIHARPLSAVLKIHRWCVRNKPLALSGTGILALLLVVAIGSPIAALRINRERRQAEANERKAQSEAVRSQQVSKVLKEMLLAAGPSVARGRDATVLHEMLEQTAERVSKEVQAYPEVQGDIFHIIGRAYQDMGDFPRATTNHLLAVASYRLAYSGAHTNLALALAHLGRCQSFIGDVGNGKSNAALGLQMARECGDTELLIQCLKIYALSITAGGMGTAEAEPYEREAVELRKQLGGDPLQLAENMMAEAHFTTNDAEFLELLGDAVSAYRKQLPPGHRSLVDALFGLGQQLLIKGHFEEAEGTLREAHDGFRKIHDPNHPYQPIVLRFLAESLLLQGKGDEAESLIREQLFITPTHAGHQDTLRRVLAFRTACASDAELLKHMRGDFLMQGWLASRPEDHASSLAKRGHWKEAAAEMAKALEVDPSNHFIYHLLAPLLVAIGDAEGYRRHCAHMQVQFVGAKEPFIAEQMAMACLILPGNNVDSKIINQWVKTALTADRKDSLFRYAQFVTGLAAYRQSDPVRAMESAQTVLGLPGTDPNPEVAAWAVIAMANHALNQSNDAVTALSKARELARTKLPEPDASDRFTGWSDWIVTHALLREAGSLIEQTAPDADVFFLDRRRPEAAVELAAANELTPTNYSLFRTRADVLGPIGQWKDAAASLSQCVKLEPNDSWAYLRLAPILLLLGDEQGYRQLCLQTVTQFSGTKDIGTADTVAKACSISPSAGVDLNAVAEAAETAVTLGKATEYYPWFALCKSLAELRQEHYPGAGEWAQKALMTAGQMLERDAAAYMVLAMAQKQSQQDASARIAFNKGAELIEKKLPQLDSSNLGGQWVDVIIANLLFREARALTEGNSTNRSDK